MQPNQLGFKIFVYIHLLHGEVKININARRSIPKQLFDNGIVNGNSCEMDREDRDVIKKN